MASPLDPLNDPMAQASDPMMQPMGQQGDPGLGGPSPLPMVPTGAAVRKQKFSIYTMALILSAIFLAISCYCLHMESKLYGEGGNPWDGASQATAR